MKTTFTIKFRKWKDGGTRDDHEFVHMIGVLESSFGGYPPTPGEQCSFGKCQQKIKEVTHNVSPEGYSLHIGLLGYDYGSDSEGFAEGLDKWREAGFDISVYSPA